MAGIGFVLERILEHRGIRGLVAVTLAGAVIVAGPWLLTTFGLTLVSFVAADRLAAFFAIIVYSYALSLVGFGGYHLLLTRRVADLLFTKAFDQIPDTIARALIGSVAAGTILGVVVALVGGPLPPATFAATIAVFASINAGWVILILLSLMQRFQWTLIAYLLGALVTAGTVAVLGERTSDAGALFAFAAGNGVTGLILVTAAAMEARKTVPGVSLLPRRGRPERALISGGASRSTMTVLYAVGLLQYVSLWADKFVFWAGFGAAVPGTQLRLFEPYDRATFLAQLTLIPPMIHFVVRGETALFRSVRKALRAVRTRPIAAVETAKRELWQIRRSRRVEQGLVQLVVTMSVVLFAPGLAPSVGADQIALALFIQTVVATQMYLFLYTTVVDLLYLGEHVLALVTVAITAVVAVAGAIATVMADAAGLAGGSFFLASLTGTVVGTALLKGTVGDLDRRILTRSALG